MSGPKILTLDIETFPILAWTFSTKNAFIGPANIVLPGKMVSWAAKWRHEDDVVFMSEHHNTRRQMVKGIHRLLNEADIVVHYNGKRFDIPHINREIDLLHLGSPAPYKQVDLFEVAKRVFKFSTGNLDQVVTELGLGKKVEHEGFALWLKCIAGDDEAWDRFRAYNIHDVVLTERLYDHWLGWIPNHPNVGLYVDEARPICPNCQGTRIQRRGTALAIGRVYQRFQCRDCGKWSRNTRMVNAVDLRGV